MKVGNCGRNGVSGVRPIGASDWIKKLSLIFYYVKQLKNLNGRKFMNKKRAYRNLVLSGEISEESAKKIIQHISDINEDDFGKDNRTPIQLKINSIGGSMYDGFAIIGAIDSSETPVYTYGYGAIMSMALPILISGHKRFAHPLTTFMYHECLDSMSYDKWLAAEKTEIFNNVSHVHEDIF